MRRTQQNADQQRRRGVRSRLVACVAAVAMLVTSVAAGTAVAAELGGGDTADQTTQNTATLEQQGAGNTDDNNQTTTNGDGQDDGDQPSDADNAAEPDDAATDEGVTAAGDVAGSDASGGTDADADSGHIDVSGGSSPLVKSEVPAAASDSGVATLAGDENKNLLSEDFTDGTLRNEDDWKWFGAAQLTAADPWQTHYEGADGEHHDTGTSGYMGSNKGDGYLQLTDDSNSQTGGILYNKSVPSRLGLDITFYQWQFGSTRLSDNPADGIGFFLTDATNNQMPAEIGPMGGGLGYAAINMDGPISYPNPSENTDEGIAYGVLGVGFDEFGTYTKKNQVGGDDVRQNDSTDLDDVRYSVTIRGAGEKNSAGDWKNGYDRLKTEVVDSDYMRTEYPAQQNGANVSGQANGVKVRIVLSTPDEDGHQSLKIELTPADGDTKTIAYDLEEALPDLISFGFSASTGGNKDAHFIRGLKIDTVDPTDGILLTKEVLGTPGQTYQEGDTVTYKFTVNNTGATELTNVKVVDDRIGYDSSTTSEGANVTLSVGGQVEFTATHVLTKEDVASDEFVNSATATGNANGNTVSSTDEATITTAPSVEPLGEPAHSKKIGDNGDGTYTLALDVTGKTQTSGGTTTTPVDVVMIIDRSSSMNEDITTSSKVTYDKVSNVVESSGTIKTDRYFDTSGWPWEWGYKDYQRAEQTSRPTDTYYVYLNGQYVEVEEQTKTVNGERDTSYQEHVRWMANGTEVDPSNTPFYTRHTSSSSMSRMDAVKEAAQGFVTAAAKSAGALAIRVGVVQFGNSSKQVIGLTNVATGASDINNKINNIYAPGSSEGTQPVDAFKEANEMLSGSTANKVVIFFTDGGPGGTTTQPFNNSTANSAINASKTLKDAGVTVWSVGVFDGADPMESIDKTANNSDTSQRMNAYMHATSSNYPNATGFADGNRGQGSNAGYYQAASTSEQLNEIFQDIFHDSTKTQAYGNVSIVDELSQWAQLADSVIWNKDAHTGNGYPVTEGVSLEVKDADGNPVREGDPNYPNGVKFYYEPVADGATDTTGTVRAVFGDTYQLQDKWTYTLKFDVKLTDAAYTAYAANEYKVGGDGNTSPSGTAQIGAEGTNLYTDSSNTPKGGKANTSAGQPGFRSNNHAYVQYTADGDQQTTDYAHPVLQLKAATLEGNAFVTVSKTVEGRPWLNGESFTFELEAQDKAPLPVDAKGQEQSSISIDKPADGSATNTGTFGTITYTKPGTYEYTLTERVPEADEQHGLNYSDAEYTITVVVSGEMKTKVIVTDSDGKTVQSGVASFVNSLAPYEYAVGDHLKLRKKLVNGTLTEGKFTFRLTDVTSYKEGASHLTIKDCKDPASGCTVTNKVPDGSDQSVAELNVFGAVTFTEPGTYYVKVVEDTDARPDSGYYVFDDRALYVKYDVQVNAQTGVLEMTRSVYREPENTDTQLDGIDENDWLSGNIDASTLTWANTYVAPVSALPLTGGDMTARVLVLVGSGVLLVAGLAWLLARRRRV